MKAISICNPWAWLIVHGFKPVENRSWATNYRGPIAIHAGKKSGWQQIEDWAWVRDTFPEIELPALSAMPSGGIIGRADLTDCVTTHKSKFFFGRYGFVLENAKPTHFYRYSGQLGLFTVDDSIVVPA